MADSNTLTRLFYPRSIAVIGASSSPTKIGAVPVSLLKKYGYEGRIYPINPSASEVFGLPAYPSLAQVEQEIDLAIVSVPASRVAGVITEILDAKVKNVVLFTSGFAEVGEEGRRQQDEIAQLAKENGVNLLGPNCLGFMNIRHNVFATFCAGPNSGLIRPGDVAIVSQSGAFAGYAYTLARERGIGLSHWITTGNQCSIDVADCLTWLANDPGTRVIMAYLEGCTDGDKLRTALRAAREAGKPVIVTKVGRTSSGAKAAASHTAALSGDDVVYETLFKQYRVIRAKTIDEFFNFGYAFSIARSLPRNRDIGLLTMSGGVGALMADDAEEAGLSLSPLKQEARDALLQRVPFAGVNNPVDITGQATSEMDLLPYAAELMIDHNQYGSLVVFLAAVGASPSLSPHVQTFVEQIRARYPDTLMALSSAISSENKKKLEDMGCMVFSDPSTAIQTLGAMAKLNDHTCATEASASPDEFSHIRLPKVNLNEAQALAALGQAGIPVVPTHVCSTTEAAVDAAKLLGYPVVMKIASPDILHKSDIGGVRLSIADDRQTAQGFADIMAAVKRNASEAQIDGILVAPMVAGGVECILGVNTDPVFGPVIMFGLGGVFVEILKDVSFRLAPFGVKEAKAMVDEVKGSALLKGARGQPAADLDALYQALAALSRFAYAKKEQIASVDINPFVIMPEGQGCLALDAVIAMRQPNQEPGA